MEPINVLLLGGHRAGKTTVMASMADDIDRIKTITDGSICCAVESNTGCTLLMKRKDLRRLFRLAENNLVADTDIPSAKVVNRYDFSLFAPGRVMRNISFREIACGYLRFPHHVQVMHELLEKSQIVLIVIDTPHLVEDVDSELGYGKYHDSYNQVKEVTHFLKTHLQNSNDPHMVIFVPVKCEKYYHQNGMNSQKLGMGMVNAMVKKGYRELIDILTQRDAKRYCTTAITPVLTMGGMEFYEFDDQSYTGLYRLVYGPNFSGLSPKYCEQPLLLIMLEIISRTILDYKKHKARAFFCRTEVEKLQQCKYKLMELVQRDPALGFEILNDPFRTIS